MCGIIAVLRRRSTGDAPDLAAQEVVLTGAIARFLAIPTSADPVGDALEVAGILESVDRALSGVPGLSALLDDRLALAALEHLADDVARTLAQVDAEVEAVLAAGLVDDVESLNAALVRSKDALWAIRRDRLRSARAVDDLSGGDTSLAAIETYASIQIALSALDRLEVRGRDSAGLSVLVDGHGLDLADPTVARIIGERRDPLFASGAVRASEPGGQIAFVYKVAEEIGELGDNTAALRAAIRSDDLLRLALRSPGRARNGARAHALGECRHHLRSRTRTRSTTRSSAPSLEPFVVAALNGDIDNHADLRARDAAHRDRDHHRREGDPRAHLAPDRIGNRRNRGVPRVGRVVRRVGRDRRRNRRRARARVPRAARQRSGALRRLRRRRVRRRERALRTGRSRTHLPAGRRRDDARVREPREPGADPRPRLELGRRPRRDQPVLVRRHRAAHRSRRVGARRDHDARRRPRRRPALPPEGDRRGPRVVPQDPAGQARRARRCLRHPALAGGVARRVAGPPAHPFDPAGRRDRSGHRGHRRARASRSCCAGSCPTRSSRSRRCSPPSSPGSACATTSATRSSSRSARAAPRPTRTAPSTSRERGAAVVAIVNRRQSDLVDKSDGVLYTSDGRDVEMSVASTKAFYSQIAAGCLLAPRLAEEVSPGVIAAPATQELLAGLRDVPVAMREVVDRRPAIAAAAHRHAPYRRFVGARRQRCQPHRRAGVAHQALRALLQVDRLRRDRGQEAHRPLGRAADPRVRGRVERFERRRRGQGARDLSRAQGRGRRDRDRGRDAIELGDRDHLGAGGASDARVRRCRHGRTSVRLRGGARHRRDGGAAARSACAHRDVGRTEARS